MSRGHLQQVDTPQTLYDNPKNEFVAGFIGSPSINLVEAELARDNGRLAVRFGGHDLTVDDQLARNRSGLADYVGRTVILGIRPEDFEDASLESDTPTDRRIKATVDLTEPLGADVLVHFSSDATGIVASAVKADAGADAEVSFGRDDDEGPTTRLVARVSPRTRIRVGGEAELTVDTSRLYFFDPESRDAI
jgi:multiple sugar transport system ATP-binding protein